MMQDIPEQIYSEKYLNEHIKFVGQREIIFSDFNNIKPAIATFQINTCVAIVGYDENNKIGFIAHYDAYTLINIYDDIVSNLKKNYTSKNISNEFFFNIHLVCGNINRSERLVQKLYESFCKIKFSDVIFTFKDKNIKQKGLKSILLDTQNGKLYDDFDKSLIFFDSELYNRYLILLKNYENKTNLIFIDN